MTISFENDNDVIVYALEKVISYTRDRQQIFVAHCVWWLAQIIGLEQGLINHIDHLWRREAIAKQAAPGILRAISASLASEPEAGQIRRDQIHQIALAREVSATPRDLAGDQRTD